MNWLTTPAGKLAACACLFGLAVVFQLRGMRSFARGWRSSGHPSQTLWVVQGFRGLISALALAALGAGILTGIKWLWIFGLVFLGEELIETGIMTLVLRRRGKDGNETGDA